MSTSKAPLVSIEVKDGRSLFSVLRTPEPRSPIMHPANKSRDDKASIAAIAILFIGIDSSVSANDTNWRAFRISQLIKLFLEFFELPAQAFDFRGEGLNSVFQTTDSLGVCRFARLFADRGGAVQFFDLHFTSQQVRKAGLFLTCLARQLNHQRLGVFRAQ